MFKLYFMTISLRCQWAAVAFFALFMASCGAHQEPKPTETEASAPASATALDKTRKIIRNADIELAVVSVEDEVNKVQEFVNTLQGHVHHYELKNTPTEYHEIPTHTDSLTIQQTYHPEAFLQIQIPSQAADTFIHHMLHQQAIIENFRFDEQDITESLADQQDQVTQSNDRYHENISKAKLQSLHYKSRYLWFDMRMKGPAFLQTHVVALPLKSDGPLWIRCKMATQFGWQWSTKFIIALIYFWPLWISFAVITWLWKGKKYQRLRLIGKGLSQKAKLPSV